MGRVLIVGCVNPATRTAIKRWHSPLWGVTPHACPVLFFIAPGLAESQVRGSEPKIAGALTFARPHQPYKNPGDLRIKLFAGALFNFRQSIRVRQGTPVYAVFRHRVVRVGNG